MKNHAFAKLSFAILAFGILGLVGATTSYPSVADCGDSNFNVLNVFWGNSTKIASPSGGMQNVPLTVVLSNNCTSTSCPGMDIEAQLFVSYPFSNYNQFSKVPTYITQISCPSTFSVTFYLDIAKDAQARANEVYTIPLTLNYHCKTDVGGGFYQKTFVLGIPLYGSANLVIAPTSTSLQPGLNVIPIKVTNNGTGYLTNISISFASQSGVGVMNPAAQKIARLAPGESQYLKLVLYNPSPSGNLFVPVSAVSSFINPYGYNTTYTTQLSFYAQPVQQSVFIYSPNTTIEAGYVQSILIKVGNQGSRPVYNLTLSLNPQFPLYILNQTKIISFPVIYPGKEVAVPILVYPQVSSAYLTASIIATATFALNNFTQTSSNVINFLTPGYINLEQVSASMLPESPAPGALVSITPTLINSGPQTARAVIAKPYPPKGIKVIGQQATVVGDIATATPTSLTLSFQLDKNITPGVYTIPVVFTYLDNLNRQFNATFNYSIKVQPAAAFANASAQSGQTAQQSKGGKGTAYTAVAAIGAAAAGVYIASRLVKSIKEKSQKQKERMK